MRFLIFLFLLNINFLVYAQLNCRTVENDRGAETTCYHKNNTVSTIETWDKERRNGHIKGLDKNSKELFSYYLRRYAGHASVRLWYHPNGQVSKVEFTSHPDGGIQSYHYISEYNENGERTKYIDLSRPDGHPIPVTIPSTPSLPQQVPKKKAEVVKCAVPYTTTYKLINETKNKVRIHVRQAPNLWRGEKPDTTFVLESKQEIIIDSITMAEIFMDRDLYFVTISNKQPGKKKFKLIIAQPIEESNRKLYVWHVLIN
ncbi:MAG: hypothetical protein ACK4ND_06530 [Cytophagaceae bacterium]